MPDGRAMAAVSVQITMTQAGMQFSGELTQDNCGHFESLVAAQALPAGAVRVEMGEFDIVDGVAAVAAVNVVRRLARERRLVLVHAPQILGHNLYRVGALGDDSNIVLEAMREDEAYG